MIPCCGRKGDHPYPKQNREHRENKQPSFTPKRPGLLNCTRADNERYDAKMKSHQTIQIEHLG